MFFQPTERSRPIAQSLKSQSNAENLACRILLNYKTFCGNLTSYGTYKQFD